MDKATFLSKVQEIGTCENQDDRLALLTTLSDEVSKDYDNMETLNTSLNETKEKLTKAQETNMAYFVRLTEQKTPEEILKNSTGVQQEKEKEYKSYNDLIKEYQSR